MTANEILELVRAGYTKTEIEALNGTQETKTEEAKEEPKTEAKEEAKTEAKTDDTFLAEQVTELAKIVKELQLNNIKSAESKVPEKAGAEDAIKDFFGMKK